MFNLFITGVMNEKTSVFVKGFTYIIQVKYLKNNTTKSRSNKDVKYKILFMLSLHLLYFIIKLKKINLCKYLIYNIDLIIFSLYK